MRGLLFCAAISSASARSVTDDFHEGDAVQLCRMASPQSLPKATWSSLLQRNAAINGQVQVNESATKAEGMRVHRDKSHFPKMLSKERHRASLPSLSELAWRYANAIASKLQEGTVMNWVCLVIGVAFVIWLLYKTWKELRDEKPIRSFSRAFYNADPQGKLYVYASEHLLTWSVLFSRTLLVIFSWRVWIVVPCVLSLAWGVAVLIIYEVPYVNKLGTKRMDTIAEYLRIFIVFKLGLYMNTSLQRWWAAVMCFKTSLTTVKELVWTVHMMNLRKEIINSLQRKCILASYILEAEMHTGLGIADKDCEEYWNAIFKYLAEERLLSPDEEHSLRTEHCEKHLGKHHGARSTLVWAWVGRIINRITDEPGVLAPMCVRLVSLCHTAMNKAEELKIHGAVQVPFSYSYLLAMLVHSNNILLAVSSGIYIAQALESVTKGRQKVANSGTSVESQTAVSLVYAAFENLWTQIFVLVFQPLMYQAFLGIAHVLNHPFGNKVFHLPSETYIRLCREELDVMNAGYAEPPRGFAREETPTGSRSLTHIHDDAEISGGDDNDDHDAVDDDS